MRSRVFLMCWRRDGFCSVCSESLSLCCSSRCRSPRNLYDLLKRSSLKWPKARSKRGSIAFYGDMSAPHVYVQLATFLATGTVSRRTDTGCLEDTSAGLGGRGDAQLNNPE